MERNSRRLIALLQQNGWVVVRVSGSHHTMRREGVEHLITVPHPNRDLPIGLVRSIYRIAGLR